MKRNKFLLTLAAIAPLAAFARIKKVLSRNDKGFKVANGEGRIHGHMKLKGVNSNILDLKVSGSDTDGALAIFEQTSVSPKRGTPLHVHPNQDEIFYVLFGEYFFQVGNDKHKLKAGDSIFLPRKVPHAWTQVSESGKMMVVLQPAGKLEEFFVTMSELETEPTKEEIAKMFLDHDMEIVGPGLKVE
ncbi:MAG: cupin domain-containing protein [Chryseolinea sp.]